MTFSVSVQAQVPQLLWSTNVGALVFAIDAQTNVYASTNGTVIVINSSGIPVSTNNVCPRPGVAQRDAAGNIYFAGVFSGSVDFGGTILNAGPAPPGGYIAKYGSSGTLLWARLFGPAQQFGASLNVGDLQVDPGGVAYVGYSWAISDSQHNSAVGRYDASGSNSWAFFIPAVFNNDDIGAARVGAASVASCAAVELTYHSGLAAGAVLSLVNGSGATSLGPGWFANPLLSIKTGQARPIANAAGNLYEVESEELVQLSPTGSTNWSYFVGNSFTLAGEAFGGVHFCDPFGNVVRFDSYGNEIWAFTTPSACTGMVTDGGGNAFLSLADGSVARLNTELPVKSVLFHVNGQALFAGTNVFTNYPSISISSDFPNGEIFYTLDGSTPDFGSIYYSGAFSLTSNATIRAIGYSVDFSESAQSDTIDAIVLSRHNLSVSTPGAGTVTLNPPGGNYLSSNVVTATATPASGWSFLYWLGDASGTNPSISVSMERDKAITAVFGTTLSTTVTGNGQILLNPPGGVYPYGTVVRLTGVPQAGNYFGFWGNAATGNTNPIYFTVENPTQTVSSIFGVTPATDVVLVTLINGGGKVTANPRANYYPANQSVTLTASPDPGQTFLGWAGNATGTNNPLTLLLASSETVTANFSSGPRITFGRPGIDGLLPIGFRLTLDGPSPATYQVFGSFDLVNWQSLGFVTNSTGEVQFTDPSANTTRLRFYKAVSQ